MLTVKYLMLRIYGAPIHCGALSFTSITFTLTGMTKLCKYYRMIGEERDKNTNIHTTCFYNDTRID